jgi:hypothetical protein
MFPTVLQVDDRIYYFKEDNIISYLYFAIHRFSLSHLLFEAVICYMDLDKS